MMEGCCLRVSLASQSMYFLSGESPVTRSPLTSLPYLVTSLLSTVLAQCITNGCAGAFECECVRTNKQPGGFKTTYTWLWSFFNLGFS